MNSLLLFVPAEMAYLLVAVAGLLMIVGFRAIAGWLFLAGVLLVLLPPFVEPLMDLVPWWGLVLIVGFFLMAVIRELASLIIGRSSTNHMIGILAADVVRATVLFPFVLLRWIIRLFR